MAPDSLLQAFKANKPAFGAWIALPGTFNARIVAQSSPKLSWVLIDCEHGLTSLQPGAAESIQAIQGVGAAAPSPIVRIPATGTSTSTNWQIKYALDAGARGVLVPMVDISTLFDGLLQLLTCIVVLQVSTAEKAKEIVADSRFPNVGRRGFGSPFTPPSWGISPAEYFTSANENILVMVQIETQEGVANVKAIAETPGIGRIELNTVRVCYIAHMLLLQTSYSSARTTCLSALAIHPHLPIPDRKSSLS